MSNHYHAMLGQFGHVKKGVPIPCCLPLKFHEFGVFFFKYTIVKISNALGKCLYQTVPNSYYFDHDDDKYQDKEFF